MNSVCSEHSPCEHGNLLCECIYCWEHDAQCRSRKLDLGRPDSGEGRLADDNEQSRIANLYCTETVPLTTEIQAQRRSISRQDYEQDFTGQTVGDLYPQLQGSTGASEPIEFAFPDIGTRSWEILVRKSHEHFQPDNSEEAFQSHIRSVRRKLFPEETMDSNRSQASTTEMLRDAIDRCGIEGPPNSPSKTDGDGVDGSCISSVDIQSNCIINAHSPQQGPSNQTNKRKRSTSPAKSTGSKKNKSSGDQQNLQETSSSSITDGIDIVDRELDGPAGQNRESAYYTFVLHQDNVKEDWRYIATTRAKQAPSFITFDHGNHLHILFSSSSSGGNSTRVRTRITRFLSATSAGNAEATITFSRVKFLRNFILYCIRYGIETTHIYGNKVQKQLTEAMDTFKILFEDRDPNDVILDAKCKLYHEEKKEYKQKRCGQRKQQNLTDIILDKIKEKKITTAQQWENIIEPEFKIQLMKEFGLNVDSYVRRIVRIERTRIQQLIKSKTLTEIMIEILNEDYIKHFTPGEDNSKIKKCVEWIEYLFKENNINIIHFLAWNEIIKTKRYKKINGMVLEGITNAGKSLILDNLLAMVKPEEIPRERDNSGFHLDQVPGAGSILFEEPMITPVNVGTWKLLLEGKTIKTDVKNKDKEPIERTPTWITTATPITNNIDMNETSQILQRIKLYIFKKSIQHREDKYTINAQIQNKLISRPPALIEPIHMAIVFIKHFDEIQELIKEEDKSHTINEKAIQLSEEVKEEADTWQTALQWTMMENTEEQNEKEKQADQDKELEKETPTV
uniref:Non-structure protein 1 n=1 Tax=Mosquito densovirus HB-3 TaxID=1607696 RepID=A0A0B5YUB2_9VIRU|nr:non-structure protein 1 [Mosquito densovirus HB-3]